MNKKIEVAIIDTNINFKYHSSQSDLINIVDLVDIVSDDKITHGDMVLKTYLNTLNSTNIKINVVNIFGNGLLASEGALIHALQWILYKDNISVAIMCINIRDNVINNTIYDLLKKIYMKGKKIIISSANIPTNSDLALFPFIYGVGKNQKNNNLIYDKKSKMQFIGDTSPIILQFMNEYKFFCGTSKLTAIIGAEICNKLIEEDILSENNINDIIKKYTFSEKLYLGSIHKYNYITEMVRCILEKKFKLHINLLSTEILKLAGSYDIAINIIVYILNEFNLGEKITSIKYNEWKSINSLIIFIYKETKNDS